jgi:hypothetical protein
VLQWTQPAELTGSIVTSDKPVGIFGGTPCMNIPDGASWCDHGEQQVPPISALGSEYVEVGYRQRSSKKEPWPYRIVGTVDGTTITFEPSFRNPTTVKRGQIVEFTASDPFVAKSQDASHPFLIMGYMTGSTLVDSGYGDPEVVRTVPPAQYLDHYVFMTDPTYPETNLVVTRKHGGADVELDCAGALGDWAAIGTSGYEYTRIDLVRHDFAPQGGCDNGRHVMKSDSPFGLTVWGWGTPETTSFTSNVSYGYAAGENVATINDVVLVPR